MSAEKKRIFVAWTWKIFSSNFYFLNVEFNIKKKLRKTRINSIDKITWNLVPHIVCLIVCSSNGVEGRAGVFNETIFQITEN